MVTSSGAFSASLPEALPPPLLPHRLCVGQCSFPCFAIAGGDVFFASAKDDRSLIGVGSSQAVSRSSSCGRSCCSPMNASCGSSSHFAIAAAGSTYTAETGLDRKPTYLTLRLLHMRCLTSLVKMLNRRADRRVIFSFFRLCRHGGLWRKSNQKHPGLSR
jgi:hypothetical protein